MAIDIDQFDLIRGSLRHVLDTNHPADVPAALLAEGWAELVDADPAAAISLLSEEAGRARSAAPVVDLAIMWGAGIAADPKAAVIFDGLTLAGAERAGRFLSLHEDRIIELDAGVVALSTAAGFDPALGLSTCIVEAGVAGVAIGGCDAAQRALATGRRALASQMVGTVDQMLADTLAYVTDRHQYERPIGSFQTVKHRLAEVKVAATAARAAVRAAWDAIDSAHATTAAIAAKCLAARAQRQASSHCFQVHGGIAFTVEHGFQQWVRRGLLLDLLLGDHDQLTRELGRMLIETRDVPRVPELRLTV